MPGEVVYDSILENKQKTKIFWEQLMLAANITSDSPPTSVIKTDQQIHAASIHEKPPSDASDQEFYDVQPFNSLHAAPEMTEGVENPKVVEVSKKIVKDLDNKINSYNFTEDNSFETEIKVSSEKEFSLSDERERSLKLKSHAESKIVLEMREMKEREDEWRRNQMSYQTSLSSVGTTSSFKEDEAFISIPTTDEGNYSEYGSEEKEEPSLNEVSRMLSPEVSISQNVSNIGFQHHRTQSLDSMSSGHSSGSGSVALLEHTPIVNRSSRRGITVKPLDEPKDTDISTFIWREKETPIEREIRLACEREEELKREKSVCLSIKDTPSPKESFILADGKKTSETPKTLATKRIESEIEQVKRREKELKKRHMEQEVHQNTEILKPSSDITDTKNSNIKNEVMTVKQNKTNVVNNEVLNVNNSAPLPLAVKEVVNIVQDKLYISNNNNVETVPKRFQPNPHQKGLMKRFIASRGKISSGFTFSSSNVQPSHSTVAQVSHPVITDAFITNNTTRDSHYGKTENSNLGSRPGYTSAEDKIQFELMEMRKREEELRRERARILAHSQPDLLNIIDDEEIKEIKAEENNHKDIDDPNKLPPMAKLRSALSNPSLLDIDNKPPIQWKQKRRSALIEEWEDRIQKSHNNE